jgi:hypothetical protein
MEESKKLCMYYIYNEKIAVIFFVNDSINHGFQIGVIDTNNGNIIPQVTKQNIVGLQNKVNWAGNRKTFPVCM